MSSFLNTPESLCLFHVVLLESLLFAAPNTKDLDVYIKRNQESGFGFRVLGGEGPDQPVGSSTGAIDIDGRTPSILK